MSFGSKGEGKSVDEKPVNHTPVLRLRYAPDQPPPPPDTCLWCASPGKFLEPQGAGRWFCPVCARETRVM